MQLIFLTRNVIKFKMRFSSQPKVIINSSERKKTEGRLLIAFIRTHKIILKVLIELLIKIYLSVYIFGAIVFELWLCNISLLCIKVFNKKLPKEC